MPKFSTRIQRRQQQRECYLVGEARRPYTHTPTLQTSLTEASCSLAGSSASVCSQCGPIVLRYKTVFKELIHQDSELNKRKGRYPHPKRAESIPYRDIKRQNEWLRENIWVTTFTAVPMSVLHLVCPSSALQINVRLSSSNFWHHLNK